MREKFEIHALQFAICALMSALDRTFYGAKKIPEWRLLAGSFNVDIRERTSNSEIVVEIHPIEWPEGSMVWCKMIFSGKRWDPYKGTVRAAHIPGLEDFSFYGPGILSFSKVSPCFLHIEGNPTLERVFGKEAEANPAQQ